MIEHNFYYFIHILIIILITIIPFFPLSILKYVYWIPLLLPISWIIFDKCPITQLHYNGNITNKDTKIIVLYDLFKKININISMNKVEDIISLGLPLLPTICAFRFLNKI